MATYTISTAVTTTAIAQDINTGDTVTVTSSGSLYSTAHTGIYSHHGVTGAGASGGYDTLNISGTVRGSDFGFNDGGTAGNDVITVASTGHIYGDGDTAVYIDGGSNTITNDGTIVCNTNSYAIYLAAGGNTITNTGSILANAVGESGIYIGGGHNTITNSGLVGGPDATGIDLGSSSGTSGHNVVTNSGTVTGYYGLYLSGDSNSVTNSGSVVATATTISNHGIEVDGDHNTIDNTGSIKATSTTTYASGVDMSGSSNTLTNSGTISGVSGTHGTGAYGDGTNNTFINKSGGVISGSFYGVWNDGDSTVLKTHGVIKGGSYGAYLEGSNNVVKVLHGGSITGTTDYGIYSSDGGNRIVDRGTIASASGTGIFLEDGHNTLKVGAHGVLSGGDYGFYEDTGASDHIFNAGTIVGHSDYGMYLGSGGGSSHIHNTGVIMSTSDDGIDIYNGGDFVTNNGTISGVYYGLDIYEGSNVVTNKSSGLFKGAATTSDSGYAVYLGEAKNTVTNDGKIAVALHGYTGSAAVYCASGTNTIVNNKGGVITDFHGAQTSNFAVELNDGKNVVTNSGKIVGTVQIGATGTNTYDGSGGHLKGTVMGGTGSDTIVLGGGHSSVIGGSGADVITAGSGPDNFIYAAASDSTDTGYDIVDGFKAGTDTFTFSLLGGHALNGLVSVTVSSLSSVDAGTISAAVTGHLDPYGAVAVSVSSGLYAGDVFLVVDQNGNSTYDTGTDYLVALTHLSGTLSASDILTT